MDLKTFQPLPTQCHFFLSMHMRFAASLWAQKILSVSVVVVGMIPHASSALEETVVQEQRGGLRLDRKRKTRPDASSKALHEGSFTSPKSTSHSARAVIFNA